MISHPKVTHFTTCQANELPVNMALPCTGHVHCCRPLTGAECSGVLQYALQCTIAVHTLWSTECSVVHPQLLLLYIAVALKTCHWAPTTGAHRNNNPQACASNMVSYCNDTAPHPSQPPTTHQSTTAHNDDHKHSHRKEYHKSSSCTGSQLLRQHCSAGDAQEALRQHSQQQNPLLGVHVESRESPMLPGQHIGFKTKAQRPWLPARCQQQWRICTRHAAVPSMQAVRMTMQRACSSAGRLAPSTLLRVQQEHSGCG